MIAMAAGPPHGTFGLLCESVAQLSGAAACWLETGRSIPAGFIAVRPDIGARLRELALQLPGPGKALSAAPGEVSGTVQRHDVRLPEGTFRLCSLRFDGCPDLDGMVLWLAFGGHGGTARRAMLEPALPLIRACMERWQRSEVLQRDLAAAERSCARLEQQVRTDALTGVENSRAFRQSATERLAPGRAEHGLILVDIDHFKRVNDVLGHAFGDAYLQAIARAIVAAFPAGTLVGRIGGDEFAVLADTPRSGTAYLAGLVACCRSGIQRAAAMLGRPELGRASMGVALSPEHAADYPDLFERADAALYAAKASGRSTAVFYEPASHARFNNRELASQFRLAARQERIRAYLQPVVQLQTGFCRGFEVLARWHQSDGRIRLPSEFDAVFRDHRIAEQLTRGMVRDGLDLFGRWLARCPARAGDARLAINLTTFDLLNQEFAFDLQSELSRRGLGWSSVTLEITEHVILGDSNGQIHRNLEELRARGAKLAMDDFGTGHGGLQHLRDWPIDILKIDRQFVSRMGSSPRDRAVVEAVLGIADRCGFEVVAEGIETADQLDQLRRMGCSDGQGHFFSAAVPPEEAAALPHAYDLAAGAAGLSSRG
ncbi:bifunctional diguanylate cyclase/phosphodiesterase [Mangrovicoccus sp. HB161399]|uniref:putative bifunctional diguanylate cyclase/phosphodiesterase n=1 Tax=Mangrovicoccus sp. HB161399 TaxID=2720392 RepID=UPI001556AAAC|nr:bifunctional diguanylate cyclase/phosphodiesterase [Mangrovicoccus sp. HB161399]